MSLDLALALRDGFDRTVRRNGLVIVGLVVAFRLARSVVADSFLDVFVFDVLDYERFLAELRAQSQQPVQDPLAGGFPLSFLDLPVSLLGSVLLASILVGFVVRIGVVRTLVSDETERLPAENFTDDLPWTLLNLVAATVIYFLAVGVGLLLFVIPGVYFAVALFFFNYEIIVERKNAIDGLAGSWDLTEGQRLPVFLLAVVLLVVSLVVGASLGAVLPSATVVAAVVTIVANGAVAVFGIAATARAYNQLRGESTSPTDEFVEL